MQPSNKEIPPGTPDEKQAILRSMLGRAGVSNQQALTGFSPVVASSRLA